MCRRRRCKRKNNRSGRDPRDQSRKYPPRRGVRSQSLLRRSWGSSDLDRRDRYQRKDQRFDHAVGDFIGLGNQVRLDRNHRIPRCKRTRNRLRRVPYGRRGDHDHAAHPNALSSARGNGGERDHARRDRGVLAIPRRVPRRAALFLPRDLYKPIPRASRSPQDHERLSAGEKDPVQTDRNRDRQRELPVVGSVARRSFLPSDRLRRPS